METRDGILDTRLNGVLIDRSRAGEHASYPTLCRGRFEVHGQTGYAIEEPTSLNVLALLPELQRIGVSAIKVEGRQRSPAYVAKVRAVMRSALDACTTNPNTYQTREAWNTTLGACDRPWQ